MGKPGLFIRCADREIDRLVRENRKMGSIKEMILENLERIINIHINSFKGAFLSFLGPRFLRHFYRGIISSPHGVGLVFINNNRIEGFIFGVINPSSFFRNLLRKKWLYFSLASLRAVLKKPSIIPRIFRTIRRHSLSLKGDNKAELISIGVDPQVQHKGIGKILVQNFLKELKSKGVQEVNLYTSRLNNEKANEFYKKMGFTLKRFYRTPEGLQMNEYIREL